MMRTGETQPSASHGEKRRIVFSHKLIAGFFVGGSCSGIEVVLQLRLADSPPTDDSPHTAARSSLRLVTEMSSGRDSGAAIASR